MNTAIAPLTPAEELCFEVWTGAQTTTLGSGQPYVTYIGVRRFSDRAAAERAARLEPPGTALLHNRVTGHVWSPTSAVTEESLQIAGF